ncbi:isocitrate/isopropylmalate dehydrogenase family protein [Promethearchaeum syntrophicum]|uniref:3-isopropylmalate dehydrogenase n=1 Tax=Promethearchaeum syntrophicum TaxID=2594042 RepID=A0A5B9D8C9_9ARCH|nr:3-isopropylmalate dehydrogenase [Candidatus Prometheoarchaeum syntrophicum]QEE15332.1 3-isopropylmalate/3-methylmalate dehydrogenase [Candidatus Prometheoarchaeum syntrophicum]
MKKKIALARGDGIGPEVVAEGIKIMKTLQKYSDYQFEFVETPLGGQVLIDTGTNLPQKSFDQMKKCDAILFGAIGLPNLPLGAAESAISKLRQGLDLYVNLRPIKLYESLRDKCPLKEEYIQNGIDMTIIRENTEGLYAKIGTEVSDNKVINKMIYTRNSVERIIKYAFEYAKKKGNSEIISVDKANLLECSQFWREIYLEIGKKYQDIKQTNFYIDAFCQWLIRRPYSVQTVVTENMFGDIISDEAAYLIGSLGMAASGNINPGKVSMYEPIHGSAPDIAGKDIANPIGTILSVKLMIEESFGEKFYGDLIENAVELSLEQGRTIDILPKNDLNQGKLKTLTTNGMGDFVSKNLKNLLRK